MGAGERQNAEMGERKMNDTPRTDAVCKCAIGQQLERELAEAVNQIKLAQKGYDYIGACEDARHHKELAATLREELADAKREREEARDIHNSNMNRYSERAEKAEARALAAENGRPNCLTRILITQVGEYEFAVNYDRPIPTIDMRRMK